MAKDRTLMRTNAEKIATRSVAPDELQSQRAVLVKSEQKLSRLEQTKEKVLEKITRLRQQQAEAGRRHSAMNTLQTKQELLALTNKLKRAIQRRDRVVAGFRELRPLVREQRAVYKGLLKKEEERQKAVARFLREWERNYDRDIRMKQKNIRKRLHQGES